MNLLIEYYTPINPERNEEYLKCIKANILNTHIEKIIIFLTDTTSELPDSIKNSTKVEVVSIDKRPTYQFFFEYCNENFPDSKCIVSNTDIIFNESLIHVDNHFFNNDFLALTRWDMFRLEEPDKFGLRFFNVIMSQDAWIFKTPITIKDCDFGLGILGCDNVIAYRAHDSGYNVKNPSKQIVIGHYHLSNHRTYKVVDTIPPPYMFLEPNDNINSETVKIIHT